MIQHRLPRLLGALGLAISLAGGTFFGTALAATPFLTIGTGPVGSAPACPTQPAPANGQTPSAVSPGNQVAFQVWAQDCDTSTLAALYVDVANLASLSPAVGFVTATYTVVRADPTVPPSTGSCAALPCGFGQLKPGDTAYATLVFSTTTAATNATNVQIDFTSTGTGTNTGSDNSHGYIWYVPSSLSNPYQVLSTNTSPDFDGAYVTSASSITVANDAIGKGGGAQSEAVTGTFPGRPVTVEDGAGFTPPGLQTCGVDTSFTDCTAFASGQFGEWVSVNVNNGETFSGAFTITIYIDASAIPSGVNKNNLVVYHQWFDPTTGKWLEETIGNACKFGGTPCRDVATGKTVWTITIQTFHNGYLRGY